MLTALQTKAVIVMFESKHFDSADIAQLLNVPEAAVVRTLQASRDVVIAMYRDGLASTRLRNA